jgi:hypothetical protein
LDTIIKSFFAPDSAAVSQVAGGQYAGDGLQFFGRYGQDGSPRCGFGTHSVVRLAVVPLSGGMRDQRALLPL